MKNVDIIIPIYNAYEYTIQCIESVIKYTDLKNNNLILINDKSPDEKILPMLEEYMNLNKKIIVLNNKENLGFVKTVNKGMKYSENDVVLLNSDTEVTKNWLLKIQNAAYMNKYIATVTPLTNNGTIASIPDFGADNCIPQNMTLEQYAEMVEKCSLNRFPQITTANGFCMFIKREVMNKIGFFNEITFDKGYGEENDFCYRALNYGYTHILCDNTFVYHKGSQSFKKENLTIERQAVIEEHMKALEEKYPAYVNRNSQFMQLNPIRDIQENIKINIELYGKKRVAFFINEWKENLEMTGGSSLHVKDIILRLTSSNYACFVICPNYDELSRIEIYLYTDKIKKLIYSIKTEQLIFGKLKFTENTYRNLLDKLFNAFKFDIVHVHHFLFQTFDIIDIAKKYNSYAIATLHDLYMLCPAINMVYKGKYCEKIKTDNCKKCFLDKYEITDDVLENWRENCYQTLKKFDKIIVPSENTRKIYNAVYKDLQIDIIEHGVEIYNVEYKEKKDKNAINIAFVGAMAVQKGSQVLEELIDINSKKDSNITIHLFGKTFENKLKEEKKNYIFHDEYKRGELSQLLINNNIDLVCMFTVWPETYSYTLSEVYMSHIPVLAFDIGAVADRLKKDKLGWVIPVNTSADKIFLKINQIMKDKKEYTKIQQNFKNYKYKLLTEMQDEYYNIYQKCTNTRNEIVSIKEMNNMQQKVDIEDLRILNENKDKEIEELKKYINHYNFLVERFNKMQNTSYWKIAKKVKGIFKKR